MINYQSIFYLHVYPEGEHFRKQILISMNSSIVKRLFIESVITMKSNEDGDKEFDTFIVRPDHTVLRRKRRTLRNSDIKMRRSTIVLF